MTENEIHFRNTDDCIKKVKSIRTMYRDTTPSYVALSDAIQALTEIQSYRAIGTVEEFKGLKEKAEPKKPYKGSFGVIRCSCCDEKVGQMVTSVLKEDCMNFCAYCGSKVDWGNE